MFKKKRVGWLMLALVLAVAAIGIDIGTVQNPSPVQGAGTPAIPRVFAMVPEWSGFIDIDEWGFCAVLITPSPEALEARFIGAQIGGRSLTSVVENEWTEVTRVEGQLEGALDRYEDLHNLQVQRQIEQIGWRPEDFEREERDREEYYSVIQQIYTRLAQLAEVGRGGDKIVARIPSVALTPGETIAVELIFEVRRAHDPTAKHRITVPTSVTKLCPLGIEDDSVWIRGDLHIHSIYSQCTEFEPVFPNVMPDLYQKRDSIPAPSGMRGRGYHFVYMADHVGELNKHLNRSICLCPTRAGLPARCNATATWNCYVTNTQRVTTTEIAFFPGAEYSTKKVPGGLIGGKGHALIYGLNALSRSDGHRLIDFQLTGPQLVNLRPPDASLAIAHPVATAAWVNWEWPIRHYRGAELMAPCIGNELIWWRDRAFTTEALNDAVNFGVVLSVRTGSDYHHGHTATQIFYQAFTFTHIPVAFSQWQHEPWATRRQRVNTALWQGRTVASRHGGFARLNVNGNLPGTVLRNTPANTTLNLNVMLRPSRTGNYELRIYRNANTLVESRTVAGTAGHTTFHNFSTVFPGVTHGYWLHVRGEDLMYSTPVIVTSSP